MPTQIPKTCQQFAQQGQKGCYSVIKFRILRWGCESQVIQVDPKKSKNPQNREEARTESRQEEVRSKHNKKGGKASQEPSRL